ncbi:tRNA (adenine(22)-N(1))-methyltransferase [Ornithinibacillus contaminans]|uniref:tRNA (adenine(22)-N(1))-methyltransferase n=1 Tax=Ornithinibacillus contaminans TaxID=694055 RepID=UPI00064DA765|nr:tRNA (adenine(22)-N(1))-methyltransferase TrmK [Ornithinibacillus contaminans]
MNERLKLSNRLERVASFLPKGANFADIGSDHAYLPCFVCLQDTTATAIAGEINEGPYTSAKQTVEKYKLTHVIDVRQGDGLAVLAEDEVSQVVIAGMGGALIRSILENGRDKLHGVELIIAQPNVDEQNVRKWYVENHYRIEAEVILEENGHIYEIIVGRKSDTQQPLDPKELLFGPLLLKQGNPLFYQKWQSEHTKLIRVLKQMSAAKIKDEEKISLFNQQLQWIEEVLRDGKRNN